MSATLYHLPVVPTRQMPRQRGDCLPGGHNEARPCVWVRCRYNTADSVDDPGLHGACVLDVADQGGLSHDGVAEVLGLHRSRVAIIEQTACRKPSVRDALAGYRHYRRPEADSNLGSAAGGKSDRTDGNQAESRYPGELVTLRFAVTKNANMRPDEKAFTDRAWYLYSQGAPCWEDKCCTGRAGHLGPCRIPPYIRKKRKRDLELLQKTG